MTKKANGVYYTPSAVVDYIVRGTLGPLLEGKSPMHPLTVLDPACGSGYFLLVSMRDRIIDIVDGIERPTAESDCAIDRLVYQLYGLSDDEIETVQRNPL